MEESINGPNALTVSWNFQCLFIKLSDLKIHGDGFSEYFLNENMQELKKIKGTEHFIGKAEPDNLS